MAVLLLYNHGDSYTVQQLHESTQIKMVHIVVSLRMDVDVETSWSDGKRRD